MDRPAMTADVLIIDDDPLLREILQEVLTSIGYRVTTAENGTEGLRRFADGHYQVIVTDVRMPGPDGWEVARRVRAASPDIGIIVMSASLDPGDSLRADNSRRLATLAKPFPLEELVAMINRVAPIQTAA